MVLEYKMLLHFSFSCLSLGAVFIAILVYVSPSLPLQMGYIRPGAEMNVKLHHWRWLASDALWTLSLTACASRCQWDRMVGDLLQ